jgi:hypothetical protein
VLEYVVVVLRQQVIRWFILQNGTYQEVSPGADGIFRSRIFPGLWLPANYSVQRPAQRVCCSGLILIAAPSSAYPGGMLVVGKRHQEEEEPSGAAPPHRPRRTGASLSRPALGRSAACPRPVRSWCTAPGTPVRPGCARPGRPLGRCGASLLPAAVPGPGSPTSAPRPSGPVGWGTRALTALHGGQAPNDPREAQTSAGRRRGGPRPLALPPRAACRGRANGRPSWLPASRPPVHTTGPRGGRRALRLPPRVEGARALLDGEDAWRRAGAWPRVQPAPQSAAPPLARLPSVPGLGPRGPGGLRSERPASPVSRGARLGWPLAVGTPAPRPRRGHARAPRARPVARARCRGPARTPPAWVSGRLRVGSRPARAWNTPLARGLP